MTLEDSESNSDILREGLSEGEMLWRVLQVDLEFIRWADSIVGMRKVDCQLRDRCSV